MPVHCRFSGLPFARALAATVLSSLSVDWPPLVPLYQWNHTVPVCPEPKPVTVPVDLRRDHGAVSCLGGLQQMILRKCSKFGARYSKEKTRVLDTPGRSGDPRVYILLDLFLLPRHALIRSTTPTGSLVPHLLPDDSVEQSVCGHDRWPLPSPSTPVFSAGGGEPRLPGS